MKNILHVIPTNSSTLDFMFPIFWKHANFGTKKIKFSILCLALNKNAFLKIDRTISKYKFLKDCSFFNTHSAAKIELSVP